MSERSRASDAPPPEAWPWILGGIALTLVGIAITAVVNSADVELPSAGRGWLFLSLGPLGLGVVGYGLLLALRGRRYRRRKALSEEDYGIGAE